MVAELIVLYMVAFIMVSMLIAFVVLLFSKNPKLPFIGIVLMLIGMLVLVLVW